MRLTATIVTAKEAIVGAYRRVRQTRSAARARIEQQARQFRRTKGATRLRAAICYATAIYIGTIASTGGVIYMIATLPFIAVCIAGAHYDIRASRQETLI